MVQVNISIILIESKYPLKDETLVGLGFLISPVTKIRVGPETLFVNTGPVNGLHFLYISGYGSGRVLGGSVVSIHFTSRFTSPKRHRSLHPNTPQYSLTFLKNVAVSHSIPKH
ncbi:hypothetical protein QVD17_31569 [Tagetes erecta]|uniref:Uncharacterized protein n=1 Tax=Tagetes erecta TaxID=13708 RepID=A0AAD8K7V3_TARER|nr:hypothetical protein QVD17_31569 [Tagetes erecta]